MPYASPPQGITRVRGRNTAADTNATLLIAAPGSGLRLVISKITISNPASTDSEANILSGSTVIWTIPAPKAGGALEVFPDPIELGVNEGLYFQATVAVTTMKVSAAGVIQAT